VKKVGDWLSWNNWLIIPFSQGRESYVRAENKNSDVFMSGPAKKTSLFKRV